MLAYSIEQAQAAPDVDRIIVSTDNKDIAAVAQAYQAEVIWRPTELSGDTATSESALLHVLDHLRDQEGIEPELVVFLQGTSPVRRADDVQAAIDTLRRHQADSLLSVTPMHGFLWRRDADELRSYSYDYRRRTRRQDGPEDLIENGSIYIFKPCVLRETNNRLGGAIATYVMPPWCAPQVDNLDDLHLIEAILSSELILRQVPPDFTRVKLLVLDFDGVLTDNTAWVNQDGTEAVQVHRGDGMGIDRLKRVGLPVLVLSSENNKVVSARCRKLDIPCIQGQEDKLTILKALTAERGLSPADIAYVGNDVNDLACMAWVGMPIAVSDAVPAVQRIARWVTRAPGGRGAVREVAEALLNSPRLSTNVHNI